MEKVESPAKVHVFYIDYGNVSAGSEVGEQPRRGPPTHRPLGQVHLSFRPPPPSLTDGDPVGLSAARLTGLSPEGLGNTSVLAQRPLALSGLLSRPSHSPSFSPAQTLKRGPWSPALYTLSPGPQGTWVLIPSASQTRLAEKGLVPPGEMPLGLGLGAC